MKFETFDFTSLDGVGASVATKIREGYTSWDHIHGMDVDAVAARVKGVSKRIAVQLKVIAAKNRGDGMEIEQPDRELTSSEAAVLVQRQAVTPVIPKKQVRLKKKYIDEFTVITEEVEVHPGVCPRCNLDILALNSMGDWDMLSEAQQVKVMELVEKHIEVGHAPSEVEKVMIRHNQWLAEQAALQETAAQ